VATEEFCPALGGISFADDISKKENESYYLAIFKSSPVMGNDTIASTVAFTMTSKIN
jgi:hypothetical protein